jgi:hypothetical protein
MEGEAKVVHGEGGGMSLADAAAVFGVEHIETTMTLCFARAF